MALMCPADLEWLVKADSPMLEILKDFIQTRHRAKYISCDTLSSQGRQEGFTNHASLNLHFPIAPLCKWNKLSRITVLAQMDAILSHQLSPGYARPNVTQKPQI